MDPMVSLVDSFIVTCSFWNNMSLLNTDFKISCGLTVEREG
jgi:hypothetical protein